MTSSASTNGGTSAKSSATYDESGAHRGPAGRAEVAVGYCDLGGLPGPCCGSEGAASANSIEPLERSKPDGL